MRTWSEVDKLKAKNLKGNSFTNKEIALKLKRSESSISHLFQREGIKLSLKERVNRRIKSVKNKE